MHRAVLALAACTVLGGAAAASVACGTSVDAPGAGGQTASSSGGGGATGGSSTGSGGGGSTGSGATSSGGSSSGSAAGGSGGNSGGSTGSGDAGGAGNDSGGGPDGGDGGGDDGDGGVAMPDATPAGGEGGAPASGTVLLVTADDPDPSPVTGMLDALMSAGIPVQQLNTSQTPLTPAAAAGKSLVIINPNTVRANVPASFKDVTVPVMVSKDGPSDTLMMATGESSTDPNETQITIVAAGDPLAAGLPMGNVTVYPKGNRVIFATPGPGAKTVATVKGQSSEIAIYYYEAGATMAGGFKAPAKRVGFFWHRTSDTTPEGRKLFLAAVSWALAP